MHRAGGATQRASAVCTRPLHRSAGATLSPRVSTSQQGTSGRASVEEGVTAKPGCDGFCPGKLCFSRELANTLMQHVRKQGTPRALAQGPT